MHFSGIRMGFTDKMITLSDFPKDGWGMHRVFSTYFDPSKSIPNVMAIMATSPRMIIFETSGGYGFPNCPELLLAPFCIRIRRFVDHSPRKEPWILVEIKEQYHFL